MNESIRRDYIGQPRKQEYTMAVRLLAREQAASIHRLQAKKGMHGSQSQRSLPRSQGRAFGFAEKIKPSESPALQSLFQTSRGA